MLAPERLPCGGKHRHRSFPRGELMSLLDNNTYNRPDAEVLPLITPTTAGEKDKVRCISHQNYYARRAGHRPLSCAAIRGTRPVCRPACRPRQPGRRTARGCAPLWRQTADIPMARRVRRVATATWEGARTPAASRGVVMVSVRSQGGGGGDGRAMRGSDPLHTCTADAPTLHRLHPRRAAATCERARSPVVKRSMAPAARLVAQPPLCSPCVPRTGREDAPPRRRYAELIGGGGAGVARCSP